MTSVDKKSIFAFMLFLLIFFLSVFALTKFTLQNKKTSDAEDEFLNADEFYEFGNKTGAVILDLRTPAEYNYAHIGSARNINFNDTLNFKTEIDKLDKSKTYLVYYSSDKRNSNALKAMKESGFQNVHLLKGGIISWKLDSRPVIKEPVQ